MSAVFLYDDATARTFEPFALTRPAGEMRAGALLVRERWALVMNAPVAGHVTSSHLTGFDEPDAAHVHTKEIPAGTWLVNARFAPALQQFGDAAILESDGQTVAVRLDRAVPADRLADGTFALGEVVPSGARRTTVAGWWMSEVWDYIKHLTPMLDQDIPVLGVWCRKRAPNGAIVIGDHAVYIEDGAEVEPSVCFDVTAGPVLVRREAHVQAFTRLVGPLYVGVGSILTTDRIAASSIGDTCKVHGELSNTIFIGHSNKGHDGFVGHSILGRWVNLGAGTITSNLKNTYGPVSLWTPSGVRDTGMQFLGTMFGDHAKTGIGVTLTTGSVLGAGANVYGATMPPKVVAPFSWGESGKFSAYRLDKFLDVAERMMVRRHVSLTESARAQLTAAYEARWSGDE
jgi:UDP-N-acetylglucosamine diphosphorylase/glucosamine-1-phosphate N-acetyltransferase